MKLEISNACISNAYTQYHCDIDNTYSTRSFSKWILSIFLNLHILQQNITFQVLWLIYTDKIENIRSNLSYVEKSNLFLQKALAEIELDKRWKLFCPGSSYASLPSHKQRVYALQSEKNAFLYVCVPSNINLENSNFTAENCT